MLVLFDIFFMFMSLDSDSKEQLVRFLMVKSETFAHFFLSFQYKYSKYFIISSDL